MLFALLRYLFGVFSFALALSFSTRSQRNPKFRFCQVCTFVCHVFCVCVCFSLSPFFICLTYFFSVSHASFCSVVVLTLFALCKSCGQCFKLIHIHIRCSSRYLIKLDLLHIFLLFLSLPFTRLLALRALF